MNDIPSEKAAIRQDSSDNSKSNRKKEDVSTVPRNSTDRESTIATRGDITSKFADTMRRTQTNRSSRCRVGDVETSWA